MMSLATSTWQRLGRSTALSPGDCVHVQVGVAEYALCRTRTGALHAVDGACPHMAARLGEGVVGPDGTLSCPWHAWTFDLDSGERTDREGAALRTHAVREVEGWIELEVSAEQPPAGPHRNVAEGPST